MSLVFDMKKEFNISFNSFQLVVTPCVRRTLNKLKEVSPNNNKAEEEKKQGEKIDAKKEDISLSLKWHHRQLRPLLSQHTKNSRYVCHDYKTTIDNF